MKQVTQTLRTGTIEVNEVPIPALTDKFVLVKNSSSVISAGTEKTKIDMGKKNLLQKAKARPDLVKQVLKKVQTEGLKKTLQTVNTRLDAPSPLGYSCAGEVVAAGGLVEGIQPGDRVACGGADYANHAEFVAVPKNLVVKIPDNVSNSEAAFTTVGSIALQGVRLAQPQMGETFVVLGLGLLGQIAVQLLRANGCKVIATDLDPALVERATKYGAIGAGPGVNIQNLVDSETNGHGVDGVLVCAGTSSNQPIELCGEITREKGRVVVVGAVRMDIPREDYFKKEINVVISRSYGPGRYDPFYEENGNDYPLGYVRFTEQRNMETFLQLLSEGKVEVASLITHQFDVDQAEEAYQLIEGDKTEPYLGILMNYAPQVKSGTSTKISINTTPINKEKISVSFYGAGNYATSNLLPQLSKSSDVDLNGLVTASGRTAQGVAKQFNMRFCAGDLAEVLGSSTDVLMVTTRHDTHAPAVVQALSSNKHVYVEKPLALNVEELSKISEKLKESAGQVMVGFNRRFSPCTQQLVEHFSKVNTPKVVNIRINAGMIPSDHWIQDPEVGGGRMIGEGCHFVDLASALVDSNPTKVMAVGTRKGSGSALLNDNLGVVLTFEDGSIANITYTADGSKAQSKEYVEMFGGGLSGTIDDFKKTTLYSGDFDKKVKKLPAQNKGQKEMLEAWIEGLKSGTPAIAPETILLNSLATIQAIESLTIGDSLNVTLDIL